MYIIRVSNLWQGGRINTLNLIYTKVNKYRQPNLNKSKKG